MKLRRIAPDPVIFEVRRAVLTRDGYACMAPRLDPAAGPCGGRGGILELDHIRDEPMMGKRAPSDMGHLVTLCAAHHRGSKGGHVWATANRPLLRSYLARMEAS